MKHRILLEIVQFQFFYNSVNEDVGLPDIDVLIRLQLFLVFKFKYFNVADFCCDFSAKVYFWRRNLFIFICGM